jgi:hypothetical protein
MAQVRLTNCDPKIVHDVLGLFRAKTLHDVLNPDNYGSGSPGNITFYDSFFRASLEKQISVLKEEFQHTLQLVVEYSDETVRMLEQIAKQQK